LELSTLKFLLAQGKHPLTTTSHLSRSLPQFLKSQIMSTI
jgi:hypothetical protein